MERRIKRNKPKISWTPDFAYALGLIATDGNLSPDMRHINFTSKDYALVTSFRKCLGINHKIGLKSSGFNKEKKYFFVQFGNVEFYRFLISIGFIPKKSKTLGKILIPTDYFFDFLRGLYDGDGTFYSYWDPRWRSSFMFYLSLASASEKFINWIRQETYELLGVKGHITNDGRKRTYQLKYAKNEAQKIIEKIYYSTEIPCLLRKRLKIYKALDIMAMSKKDLQSRAGGVTAAAHP